MTTDELIALMSPTTLASLVRDLDGKLDGKLDGSTREEDIVCGAAWRELKAIVGPNNAAEMCRRSNLNAAPADA